MEEQALIPDQHTHDMHDIYVEEDNKFLRLLREDDELIKIQSQTKQLTEIFRELNEYVCCQGEQMETIDENIEQAAINVEQAHEELIVAEHNQTKGVKLKLVLAILLTGAVTGPVGVLCGMKAAVGVGLGVGLTGLTGALIKN